MKILREGQGPTAAAGGAVEVHYTGWLFDPEAEDEFLLISVVAAGPRGDVY